MGLKIMMLDVVVNSGNVEPTLIDYNHLNLNKKRIESKGLVDKTEYYLHYDHATKTYSDLMLYEEYQYEFNSVVYTAITTTINWLNEDESVGLSASYYRPLLSWEIINFGITKRTNIISKAKLYVLTPSVLGYTNGVDLLQSVDSEIDLYIQGLPPTILTNAINALIGTKPYLTQPIADAINAILSDV